MGKYDPRLPDRRLGLKDAGFNNLRQERERPAIQQNGEIATYDATAIGSRSPTYNFNAVRLRFECAQILQIKCPESVFDRVADTDNSIFQTVSKQDDERASTSAQLGSTDSARTARVESAITFHSIPHPRIGVPDTAQQLLPAHPIT